MDYLMDRFIIAAFIGVLSSTSYAVGASPYKLLSPTEISFEGWKTLAHRDSYLGKKDWTHGAAFNVNTNIIELPAQDTALYFNNFIHMDMIRSAVKEVGWKFEYGLKFKKVDFFFKHHSRHLLDEVSESDMRFPNSNRVGIRIKFVTGK